MLQRESVSGLSKVMLDPFAVFMCQKKGELCSVEDTTLQ